MTVCTIIGDCRSVLPTLPADSVHCVVTSPPYWSLRDYGVAGQIGLEPTYQAFIAEMVAVFREVRRVLRPDGTLWLNLGDAYVGSWGAQGRDGQMAGRSIVSARQIEAHPHVTMTGSMSKSPGLKPKDLCGIPWRVAFALQEDGWWLRQDIIWAKPNPMPESVTDRCTKAHEYVFLMSKSARYYYDAEAIKERAIWPEGAHAPDKIKSPYGQGFTRNAIGTKGNANGFRGGSYVGGKPGNRTEVGNGPNETLSRNKRSVWEIATVPFSEAHFATFPPALVEPCIKAGTSEKGCCAKCGAPWVREIGKTNHRQMKGGTGGSNPTKATGPMDRINVCDVATLGWSPSCKCDVGVAPCTVLDPFGGAGTTGLVADRLQRNAILIELNPKYAEMAERRITGDAPLFAEVS